MSAIRPVHPDEPKRLLDASRARMTGRSLLTREEAHAIVE
jgi:hypothetical protein